MKTIVLEARALKEALDDATGAAPLLEAHRAIPLPRGSSGIWPAAARVNVDLVESLRSQYGQGVSTGDC